MDKIIGCVQHDCEQCKKKNVPLSDDALFELVMNNDTVLKMLGNFGMQAVEPLSDDEIDKIVVNCETLLAKDIARAIEQALKEKNEN